MGSNFERGSAVFLNIGILAMNYYGFITIGGNSYKF